MRKNSAAPHTVVGMVNVLIPPVICIVTMLVLMGGFFGSVAYAFTGRYHYIEMSAHIQVYFLLEILFISIGVSRSRYSTSLLQISSRLFCTYTIVYLKRLKGLPLSVMFMVWNVADLIRYLFYLFKTPFLRWLRYSAFIALYPVGVALELWHISIACKLSSAVPGIILACSFVIYVPGFLYLYRHMLSQREKHLIIKLGGGL